MITEREIVFALGTSDMSNRTLKHKLCQYVDVCLIEVDEIIRKGVDGWLEPFVAWVLGLKKYIPDGFNPKLRNVAAKQRQYILGLNYDNVTSRTLAGTHEEKSQFGGNRVLPVGTITIRKNKNGGTRKRSWIKLASGAWQPLCSYVWEQANGKILRSEIIRHKDGNELNDDIENLEMITRTEFYKEKTQTQG